MPSCTRHTWASVCLHEQICVCLLNESCFLFHLAMVIPSWQQLNWYTNIQTDPRDMLCASKCVCVFMLNEYFLLFHLALMMDLCVFSYMHAFVHSSYVSERVLARADVCMFANWMLSVAPSSPDYSILTAIKLIHEHANRPTRHVCF